MSYTWGPPIWTLFHTIIEHASEKEFSHVGKKIYSYIYRICGLLPCPECRSHAQKYLDRHTVDTSSKTLMREFMHNFHNMVNKHKKYNEQPITILDKYNDMSLSDVYNKFIQVFSSRGNIRMLADSMHRSMLIQDFKSWLITNNHIFFRPAKTSS